MQPHGESKVNTELKVVIIVIATVPLCVIMTLCYNLYIGSKQRELYNKCLEITLALLKENPNSVSTPYCRY